MADVLPDFPSPDTLKRYMNTRCSTCKKEIVPTMFKNCPSCRANRTQAHKLYTQRRRDRVRAAHLLLSKSSGEQHNTSSSPAQPPLKKMKVDPAFDIPNPVSPSSIITRGGRQQPQLTSRASFRSSQKRAQKSMAVPDASRSSPSPTPRPKHSPKKPPVTHPYYGEEDEYQDAPAAFQALRDHRQSLSPLDHDKLNFRLTYVIVADPSVDNNQRIGQVAKSLRDEIGLKFS
ncbi:hypothetical protein OF83DRAFT_1170818, partial [Amylostereum chailletii]